MSISTDCARLLAWIVIISAAAACAFSLWQQRQAASHDLLPVSRIIAQQLADAAAPLVLDHDNLSLQALSAKLSQHKQVKHVAVYDLHSELLAQSGKARLATSDVLANAPITLQNRMLGYTRVALRSRPAGAFSASQTLMLTCLGSAFACLLLLTRPQREEQTEQLPDTPAATEAATDPASVEHAILAVELLQFPMMRKQLNEDTLYEYISTFQHWLRQVAAIYNATISVGDRGFTLLLEDTDCESLAAQAVQCAYTLNEVLHDANQQRKQQGDLIYEVRVGVHIASRRCSAGEVIQQLHLQEAERISWNTCDGKASGTISLTRSLIKLHYAETMQLEDNPGDDSMQLLDLVDSVKLKLSEQIKLVLGSTHELHDSVST